MPLSSLLGGSFDRVSPGLLKPTTPAAINPSIICLIHHTLHGLLLLAFQNPKGAAGKHSCNDFV